MKILRNRRQDGNIAVAEIGNLARRGPSAVSQIQNKQKLSGVLPVFRIRLTGYREDCLICYPSNKVIRSDPVRFLALIVGGSHEDKLCHTLQAMAPINVKTVHPTSLTPYPEQPRDRLGLLSPSKGQIKLQSVLMY